MKVFTFFYRKVVIQILKEIVPYLQAILSVVNSCFFNCVEKYFLKKLITL